MSDAFYDAFASALRTGENEAFPAPGFAVYRNNVLRGAIEALRAAYPAVDRLVGSEFFDAMAKTYWQTNPPVTPSLTLYGARFAEHIEAFPAASSLPWLPDTARHDRAWLQAHHAAEEAPLSAQAVNAMNPERLPGLAPGLHVSVHLLRSDWPAFEIWRRNRFDTEPDTLIAKPGQYFSLLWRRRGEVRHTVLDPARFAFLEALGQSRSLEEAAGNALAIDPAFDASAAFGAALSDEILKGFSR